MKPFRIALALSALAVASLAAAAPVKYSGNGHYYDDVLSSGITYGQAVTAAAALSYMGMPGHLATWEDPGELNFIGTTFTSAIPSGVGTAGFWLGAGSTDAANNTFTYVTGGPADTTGFVIDHAEGSGAEGLGLFNLNGSNPYYGDYIASNQGFVKGYVVEYQPTPEPATFAALGLGAVAALRRRKRA